MEFNSLDAQREAAEAYIKSQQHEGWVLMPEHYDDGGFSGGTMDRPAITRHKKIQPLYHRLEAVHRHGGKRCIRHPRRCAAKCRAVAQTTPAPTQR